MDSPPAPPIRRSSPRWARVLSVIGMILFGIAALLASGAAMLGFLLGGGYELHVRLEDPKRVADAIGAVGGDHLHTMSFLAWCLLISGIVTAVAGLMRSRPWVGTGLTAMAMLGGVLALGTPYANTQFDQTMAHAQQTLADAAALEPRPATIPQPTPLTPPPPSLDDTTAGVRDMIARTFEVAVGDVVDERGLVLTAETVQLAGTACDEHLTTPGAVIRFQTNDNRSSLTHILAAWDEAGYLPDRATQLDIRYSEELPVEHMEIRDRTTIDGMLHMVIRGQCSAP